MSLLFGPLKDAQGELVVISRQDASDQGRSFFYTGKPCRKRGHHSVRYVSNGCCKACLNQTFKPRVNPWTKKLSAFSSTLLWTGADLTKAERIVLRVYLQHCIFEYLRKLYASRPLTWRAELEEAMLEIENRGRFASVEDPRNTD
jgi:hypothetical protein